MLTFGFHSTPNALLLLPYCHCLSQTTFKYIEISEVKEKVKKEFPPSLAQHMSTVLSRVYSSYNIVTSGRYYGLVLRTVYLSSIRIRVSVLPTSGRQYWPLTILSKRDFQIKYYLKHVMKYINLKTFPLKI